MKTLGILGFSGHGKVVAEAALLSGWSQVIFYDDAWQRKLVDVRWPIKGDTFQLIADKASLDAFFVAIGDNAVRHSKLKQLSGEGLRITSVIHPSAIISTSAVVGKGSFVAALGCVQIDTQLGDGCIVNTGATVDHDCILGHCVHVSPGANLAGGVQVGAESWIGIGASVIQQIRLGQGVVVGAGSVVINDIPEKSTVVGVPARNIDVKQ